MVAKEEGFMLLAGEVRRVTWCWWFSFEGADFSVQSSWLDGWLVPFVGKERHVGFLFTAI